MSDRQSLNEFSNTSLDLYKENPIIPWKADLSLIRDWLNSLDEGTAELVLAAIRVLEQCGPNLKRPLVGSVKGSRFRNMKELRPGSSGSSEVRILFAFDPKRRAIMLLAGDKQRWWNKWYRRAIPEADRRYQKHLDRMLEEGGGNGTER